MCPPLLCPEESSFHVVYKQSGWLVHLQRLPKQELVHLPPSTCLRQEICQWEFKLCWCYPSLTACCNKERPQRGANQRLILAGIWCRGETAGEVPVPPRGPVLLPAYVWLKASPCQAQEAEERGMRPAKGTSLGATILVT